MATTPRIIRNSERGDFKRCPWYWHKSWILGYSNRRPPTWAWFGTAIHRGLEARYPLGKKRGNRTAMLNAFRESLAGETRRVWLDYNAEIDDQKIVDAKVLGEAMLLGYVEEHGEDTIYEVLATEQTFQVDVVDPKTGELIAIYCGTWDLVVKDRRTGRIWVWDHKTRRAFLTNWEYLSINDQAGAYLWVAPEVLAHMGLVEKDTPIEGIIFNYLKKTMPTTKTTDEMGRVRNNPTKEHYLAALREKGATLPNWWPKSPKVADYARAAEEYGLTVYGEISKVQPGPRYHREETYRDPVERVTMGQRIVKEVRAMNWMLEDPEGRLFKTPTEDCTRCPLFEMCQLDERDPFEAREFADTMLTKRDPYRDHREAMARDGIEIKEH